MTNRSAGAKDMRAAPRNTRASCSSSTTRSPHARRARSCSPSRSAPRLCHVQGRLQPPNDAHDIEPIVLATLLPSSPVARERPERSISPKKHLQPSIEQKLGSGELLSRSLPSLSSFPKRVDVRRVQSCAMQDSASEVASAKAHRLRIFYRDERIRERCAQNTRRMIVNAKLGRSSSSSTTTASSCSSTQQLLALKALKYRKLLPRVEEIDQERLADPTFDLTSCLGVEWCKLT